MRNRMCGLRLLLAPVAGIERMAPGLRTAAAELVRTLPPGGPGMPVWVRPPDM
jgi:hypothetical protein